MSSILITGASRGVGRALALACAASGLYSRIILNALHDSPALKQTARDCAGAGDALVIPSAGDVGDLGYVESLRRLAGPADTLVNNAGIAHIGLLTDMGPEEWDRLIRTNLTGVFNTCRTFAPDMGRAGGGRILNVSSVWGLVGASCEVAYSASKGGVNAFTKALARELAPSHVCVNAVALGMVDTEMNAQLSSEAREELRDQIPAGYIARPEEAAQAILKLLQMPEYFNGEIVKFDGCWI